VWLHHLLESNPLAVALERKLKLLVDRPVVLVEVGRIQLPAEILILDLTGIRQKQFLRKATMVAAAPEMELLALLAAAAAVIRKPGLMVSTRFLEARVAMEQTTASADHQLSTQAAAAADMGTMR
jgi:hypothetical protein